MTISECRKFYSEEVRWCSGAKSAALIEAFAKVPREKHLGPGPWQVVSSESLGRPDGGYVETSDPRDLYHNILVALNAPCDLNNGQPSALAHWIDALDLKSGDRVFHLGCGTGYYTAIMAELLGAGGRVVACEVDTDLAARAKANLADYAHVEVHAVDGSSMDAGEFDAMLINAGVTHPNEIWLNKLREGGRLVMPLTATRPQTPEAGGGAMMKIVRKGEGFSAGMVTYVAIFSCTSGRDAELNVLIGKAMATGNLAKVKSLRRDAHEHIESCIVHGGGLCWSTVE